MSSLQTTGPAVLHVSQLDGLRVQAATVDVRRDIFVLIRYIQEKSLTRTVRGNGIPQSAARRLAKLLSFANEANRFDDEYWPDCVCDLARLMGLVSYDIKGILAGYSSTEPSFPDNQVRVNSQALRTYLAGSPLEKESALLHIMLESTPNEFFHSAALFPGSRLFSHWGSRLGPASRMKLPAIRRGLLKFLAELEAGPIYEFRSVVDLLQKKYPHLILDPATREQDRKSTELHREWQSECRRPRKGPAPPSPPVVLEDIYSNFRGDGGVQYTSETPDVFQLVEGRFLEGFLKGALYLLGCVELVWGSPTATPERLHAFRLTPRFFQLMSQDPDFGRARVTVLPTMEVLVEALSYPETLLSQLDPYAVLLQEASPIYRLRLERRKVVESAARDPQARPTALLDGLVHQPLPDIVRTELDHWTGQGDKLVIYDGYSLIEMVEGEGVPECVREFRLESCADGFTLVHQPERAFQALELDLLVPVRVLHGEDQFSACPGRLGSPAVSEPPALPCSLQSENIVAYSSSHTDLLKALQAELTEQAATCQLVGGRLFLSATALPRMRAALRGLSRRFEVTLDDDD